MPTSNAVDELLSDRRELQKAPALMSDPDIPADAVRARANLLPHLADLAAVKTLAHFRQRYDVADKSDGGPRARFDPVTVADREAEEAIRACIAAEFPDDAIVGEEYGVQAGTTAFNWVIDPIDGTRAYVCGAPTWGTLIAVLDGKRSVAGIMDQPFTRERYAGSNGETTLRHAGGEPRRMTSSSKSALADAYLSTTSPDLFDSARGEVAAFDAIRQEVQQVRYGLDCYAYCLLAGGTLDVVVEAGLNSYDIAALIPIVEGAGGIVTTWSGAHPEDGGQIIASANGALHEQALDLLRPFAAA